MQQVQQGLKISQKINIGFMVALILAMGSIYMVVEKKIKPDLIAQRQQQITISQQGMVSLLAAKLTEIQLLTSTLASAGSDLPKDEALFKQVFPPIIDNQGKKAVTVHPSPIDSRM